jgi:hypothetical protein
MGCYCLCCGLFFLADIQCSIFLRSSDSLASQASQASQDYLLQDANTLAGIGQFLVSNLVVFGVTGFDVGGAEGFEIALLESGFVRPDVL